MGDSMVNESQSDSILLPAPTAWPFLTALGIALVFTGLVTHPAVSMVGALLFLRAATGWWREVLPIQKEEAVAITLADLTAAPIPRSRLTVEHLRGGLDGHRVRIPVEVHPYWSGVYGGAAGAVAMAVVALAFGLIAQRSIWYPINLLAAGILPSLGGAPVEQLRQFSAVGLIAGSIIHGTISLLVGMLYAISLPMFPRGATWRSGLISPILWSGLVAASLGLINPTLNERIDWGWFIASQMAFGLAAGRAIAGTARIATMQSWPLAERAGIQAQRNDSEGL